MDIIENRIELKKIKNEANKIHISKIEVLIDILEASKPCDLNTFGDSTKYISVLDEIDEGIVKNKLLQLIKKL